VCQSPRKSVLGPDDLAANLEAGRFHRVLEFTLDVRGANDAIGQGYRDLACIDARVQFRGVVVTSSTVVSSGAVVRHGSDVIGCCNIVHFSPAVEPGWASCCAAEAPGAGK
jgi:hypothetical protein